MGQDMGKIVYDTCGPCGPEDPSQEPQGEFRPQIQTENVALPVEHDLASRGDYVQQSNGLGGYAAPNYEQDYEQGDAFPVLPPSPVRASGPSSSAARGPGPPMRVDIEFALMDLEGTESSVYEATFKQLANGKSAVAPDHTELRIFLVAHSCLGEGDLDTELLKAASANDNFTIDSGAFVELLREHAAAEGDCINKFISLAGESDSIMAFDCRNGLLLFLEQVLGAHLNQKRADVILDAVMCEAGLAISMEEWVGYCKRASRVVRLMRYAGTNERAVGVRGGA